MEKINFANYKIKTPTKNFKAEWETHADEMTAYFKRNCYWLFYRYPKWKLIDAYKECKNRGIASFQYLLGILKNSSFKN